TYSVPGHTAGACQETTTLAAATASSVSTWPLVPHTRRDEHRTGWGRCVGNEERWRAAVGVHPPDLRADGARDAGARRIASSRPSDLVIGSEVVEASVATGQIAQELRRRFRRIRERR